MSKLRMSNCLCFKDDIASMFQSNADFYDVEALVVSLSRCSLAVESDQLRWAVACSRNFIIR